MLRQKWPNSDHFFEGSIKVKRTPASNDVEVKCNYYLASSGNFFPFKSLMHITESTAHVKKNYSEWFVLLPMVNLTPFYGPGYGKMPNLWGVTLDAFLVVRNCII
jgi:hypothetical protein